MILYNVRSKRSEFRELRQRVDRPSLALVSGVVHVSNGHAAARTDALGEAADKRRRNATVMERDWESLAPVKWSRGKGSEQQI